MPRSKAEHAAYMKQYWRDNPEKYAEKIRKVSELRKDPEHWARVRLGDIKSRAKRNGLEFDLDTVDLTLPEACPVLGIPLILGGASTHPNTPHVDRIRNTGGYTKDNVRIISSRANLLKRDATVDELKAVLNYMES